MLQPSAFYFKGDLASLPPDAAQSCNKCCYEESGVAVLWMLGANLKCSVWLQKDPIKEPAHHWSVVSSRTCSVCAGKSQRLELHRDNPTGSCRLSGSKTMRGVELVPFPLPARLWLEQDDQHELHTYIHHRCMTEHSVKSSCSSLQVL